MDMTFSVEPSGAALGALIHGLDLARSLADEEAAALRRELLQHLLLVFPEQNLTAAQLAGFCRRFGAITRHILDQYHHPEEPDLCIISNTAESGAGRTTARMAGSYWHSDLSYLADPADFSMLYAIDVPESGGDTIFANLYQAYETLPEDLRARLHGLSAEHHIMAGSGADAKVVLSAAQRARAPGAVHPILRRHPETGREALFVNPGFTRRVEGMDAAASAELLGELDLVRGYTDCFGHALALRGAVDVMLDAALHPWDLRASQILIEEAGGSHRTWASDRADTENVILGTPALVEALARRIEP